MKFLLIIWKRLPFWLQGILSRIIRPSFQVFAAAAIFDQDQKILLEKLTYQDVYSWGLPGGNVDTGEEPEDAVVREVKEEIGFDVEVKKLLMAKNANAKHILGLFYWCEIIGGHFSPTLEVSEIKYFALDDLPDVRPSDVVFLKQLSEKVDVAKRNWLEVSLTVNGELAEAVADVLARFAPNGVVTEQGVKFVNDEDEGTATGPITVRAYLPADGQLEDTRQKLEESLYYLGMIQPLPPATFKMIADQNWMEAWKQHYKPIPIGQRLIIIPAWIDSPEPERIPIKINPGMAFGTGTHPTTQLCMALMEKAMENKGWLMENRSSINHDPLTIIDVGCGSGILSIAALKLGATSALGVDIDLESVKNSRENADTNSIGDELILGKGSVKEILDGKFAFKSAPLLVANILAPIIIRLFDAGLADLLEPGGTIILSGILQGQAQNVIEAAQAKGLRMNEQRQMGDWVALAMSR